MYEWKGRHCDGVYWGDSVTRPRGEGGVQTDRDDSYFPTIIYMFLSAPGKDPQDCISENAW